LIKNFESSFGLINNEYGKIKIIYVWFTEIQKNLENRMKSPRGYERYQWEEVINGMISNFEEPTEDEGYDEILKINPFKD